MLAVECDATHIQKRLDTGYCDAIASTLDEALDQIREGLSGNLCRCTGYLQIFTAVEQAIRQSETK